MKQLLKKSSIHSSKSIQYLWGDSMFQKVVVVGAGMMGSGIASRAALAGKQVQLVDVSIDRAHAGLERAKACLDELAANDLCTQQAIMSAKERLEASDALESALVGADLVIEAIIEDLSAKQQMFERLDVLLPPEVPILSNTSGLRITDIAAHVKKHPERTMTAHFWLPAHLVPLVEIVLWERTDAELAKRIKAELQQWGKAPVIVQRDLPGQLANRILQAIIREATNIVAIGLGTAEDVDTAIKMGLGIRLPAWGPLEHIDAVGLDLALSVQDCVLPNIDSSTENLYLRKLVENGELGYKSKKGVYDWNELDMDAAVKRRNDFIIHALKKVGPKM